MIGVGCLKTRCELQPVKCFPYHLSHPVFIRGEEQVAPAAAITGTKARDAVQLPVKSLSNGAFIPLLALVEKYPSHGCLVPEIINVPVGSSRPAEVVVQSGTKATHG